MYRFVEGNAGDSSHKRKQVQRACNECRRRKKRCTHVDANGISEQRSTTRSSPILSSTTSRRVPVSLCSTPSIAAPEATVSNGESGDNDPLPPSETELAVNLQEANSNWHEGNDEDDTAYIGDLNPEGTFLADRTPSASGPATDSAGVWLPRKMFQSKANHEGNALGPVLGNNTLLSKLVFSHLEESCFRQLPTKVDYQALRSIYIEYVHPLFPVVDLSTIPLPSDESPRQITLKQAICLAATTSPLAKPYLNLPTENGSWTLKSPKDFASQMSTSIRTSIHLNLVRNRIRMLQIFSLLSLFTQLTDDKYSSAEDNARAVSYLHTIGLHLETREKRSDHGFVTRLFCCVWLLDRLNAAFHGRPVLMHERDFGRNLEECFVQQAPEFQLFLRTTLLLDQVIVFYRPAADEANPGWNEGFPPFEDLIYQSGASGVRSSILATIETLYHAVAMLTCRSKSMTEVVRSSASFARQMLSATAVVHVVATEYRGQLSLLPIVPYAVSLALRCAYREVRLSKSTFNRQRAKRQLITSCDVLRELAETFPAAMLMVELVDQTLREMDKVVSSILNTQQQSIRHKGASGNAENGEAQESMGQEQRQASQQAAEIVSTEGRLGAHLQEIASLPVDDPRVGTNLDIFNYFDPNFDLDTIDAILGDNIDLSFPFMLSDPET